MLSKNEVKQILEKFRRIYDRKDLYFYINHYEYLYDSRIFKFNNKSYMLNYKNKFFTNFDEFISCVSPKNNERHIVCIRYMSIIKTIEPTTFMPIDKLNISYDIVVL